MAKLMKSLELYHSMVMHALTIFVEYGIMAYIPCMAKPMKSLELYHSMVPFLINIIVDRQGLVELHLY